MTKKKPTSLTCFPPSKTPVRQRRYYLFFLISFASLILVLSFSYAATAENQVNFGYIREIGKVQIDNINIAHPVALGYSAADQSLIILGSANLVTDSVELYALTTFGELVAKYKISSGGIDPLNFTYDSHTGRLVTFDRERRLLTPVPIKLTPEMILGDTAAPIKLPSLTNPLGMTSDPESGGLYILDSAAREIVRLAGPGYERMSPIPLNLRETNELRTLAYNPENRHLYTFSPEFALLYEFELTGRLVATYKMDSFGLGAPHSMVFAPSKNQFDDPEAMNLYVAGGASNPGISEFSFATPRPLSAVPSQPTLVQTIEVWQFDPPSPDAAGVTYLSNSDTLLETDSEVNEKPVYEDVNQFEMTLSGTLVNTYDTTHFSKEPTGVAFNPNNNHLYFSDDRDDMVWETDLSYNLVNSFPAGTLAGLNVDPEGIAYDSWNNRLFIAGGVSDAIFWVYPGQDGAFGTPDDEQGAFPSTDLSDPEGIAFNTNNGHIYAVGTGESLVAEYTTNGEVVGLFDVSAADPIKLAGLAYGPTSSDAGQSIYVSDRGRDSDGNVNKGSGDGMIYEFAMGDFEPSAPPTVEFNGEPTTGVAPFRVDFTDLSSGMPTSWSWDFGDGGASNFQHPSYTYAIAGTFQVSLSVANSKGNSTETKVAYIKVTRDPINGLWLALPSIATTRP